MCDFQGRLIAWLDNELAASESADVERHVQTCLDCQGRIAAYKEASVAFDAYSDAVLASTATPHNASRWAVVLSGVAAAIIVILLLSFPRARVQQLASQSPAAAAPPAIVAQTIAVKTATPAPIKRRQPPRAVAPVQNQNTNWEPPESAIEITIPADDMFPPGAIPEGVNFVADVSIAPDGSMQRLRLQPRLVGFERRASQP